MPADGDRGVNGVPRERGNKSSQVKSRVCAETRVKVRLRVPASNPVVRSARRRLSVQPATALFALDARGDVTLLDLVCCSPLPGSITLARDVQLSLAPAPIR